MPRLLAVFALSFSFLFPFHRGASPRESVRPLQWIEAPDPAPHTHCSTWPVEAPTAERTVWMTAGHCVLEEDTGTVAEGRQYLIDEQAARLVAVDPAVDLAILVGSSDVKPLTLASGLPDEGDRLIVYAFPFGWPRATTQGTLSQLVVGERISPWLIFNVAVAPGTSGGAIINDHGQVVGIVQIQYCAGLFRGFCPMGGGAGAPVIRAFLATLPLASPA